MRLSLSVVGTQAETLGDAARVAWVDAGGTIGRAENNDWMLPDPRQEISRCHARVRYVGGAFYLEDASANGIFLNERDNRLSSREMHRLEDGERLFIGDYEIRVEIGEGAPEGSAGPPAAPGGDVPDSAVDAGGQATPDPLDLLGGAVETPREPGPLPDDDEPGYLREHFEPAPVRQDTGQGDDDEADTGPAGGDGPGPIPTDWWRDLGRGEPSAPSADDAEAPGPPPDGNPQRSAGAPAGNAGSSDTGTEPPEARPERPRPGRRPTSRDGQAAEGAGQPDAAQAGPSGAAGTSDDALRQLLAGAGLDPATLTPETAETLGRVLRIAVEGMMDLLRARTEVKNEFRMAVTLIQATDNNPLKFSTSAQDALHNLLVKRNPDYLGAEEAFLAGFDDLRFHQMALLAGMREAFFAVLDRFDPDSLEAAFGARREERPVLGRISRRRYWEQYRELYREIRQDSEGSFNRLFGEAFVEAYERQMDELTASRERNRRE